MPKANCLIPPFTCQTPRLSTCQIKASRQARPAAGHRYKSHNAQRVVPVADRKTDAQGTGPETAEDPSCITVPGDFKITGIILCKAGVAACIIGSLSCSNRCCGVARKSVKLSRRRRPKTVPHIFQTGLRIAHEIQACAIAPKMSRQDVFLCQCGVICQLAADVTK